MMFKKKIRVAVYLNHKTDRLNACTMYRITNPLKYLSKYVEVRYVNEVKTDIEYNPVQRKVLSISIDAEPIEWADMILFSRHYDNFALVGRLAEIAMEMKKPIVYETDDLLHRIEDNIGQHKNVPIARVRDGLKLVDYLIQSASLFMVSTDYLKEFYYNKFRKNTIEVFNNYYDPTMWRGMLAYKRVRDFWRKKIKRDKTFRIGWQGGNNHLLNNMRHLIPALNELKKKHGDKFQFVYMGANPRIDTYNNLPDNVEFFDFDFEYHRPTPNIFKFPRKLVEMDIDAGLIVVDDNKFSRAKSNIKWLEYALTGVPSISTDCLPYRNTNAILVENSKEQWIEAIESLMFDEARRDILSQEALKMARTYDIRLHARRWLGIYQRVLDEFKSRNSSVIN